MSSPEELEELGRRIRVLRTERQLTLRDVESRSGLSATHLSEIERGHTSPTIGALNRIARALSRDPSYFIEAEERADVARGPRESAPSLALAAGVSARLLSPGIPGSELLAYRVELEPGPEVEWRIGRRDGPGDLLGLVTRGAIEAQWDDGGDVLAEGDALHAPHGVELRIRPRAGGTAELIAITPRALGAPR